MTQMLMNNSTKQFEHRPHVLVKRTALDGDAQCYISGHSIGFCTNMQHSISKCGFS